MGLNPESFSTDTGDARVETSVSLVCGPGGHEAGNLGLVQSPFTLDAIMPGGYLIGRWQFYEPFILSTSTICCWRSSRLPQRPLGFRNALRKSNSSTGTVRRVRVTDVSNSPLEPRDFLTVTYVVSNTVARHGTLGPRVLSSLWKLRPNSSLVQSLYFYTSE